MNQRTRLIVAIAAIALVASLLAVALTQCSTQPTPGTATPQEAITPSSLDGTTATPEPISMDTPGPSPTPAPYLYLVTPTCPPSMSVEEHEQQVRQELWEAGERAQAFYDAPWYRVAFELENPVFRRVFPDAHMYAVWTNADTTADVATYTTMVTRGDKDYRMPEDFNQLMFDAGYELTDETRDPLAHALIIAALPTDVILQPVTCDKGREIDDEAGIDSGLYYKYEVHCQVVGRDIGDIIVKFDDFRDRFGSFEDQFRGGSVRWELETKDGVITGGYGFGTHLVEPGEE